MFVLPSNQIHRKNISRKRLTVSYISDCTDAKFMIYFWSFNKTTCLWQCQEEQHDAQIRNEKNEPYLFDI